MDSCNTTLTWTPRGVFLVGGDGKVWRGDSASGPWAPTAQPVGGQPAAWDSGPQEELLVALHDGTIKESTDSGASWTIRSE